MSLALWHHNKFEGISFAEYLQSITDLASAKRSAYVCLMNVHMLIEAQLNPSFSKIVSEADIITPDGVPLTWMSKILYGIQQERVAGMDLLPALLNEAEQKNISVFFYGGSPNTLQQTSNFLKTNYPQLKVAGMYSPPFRELKKEEDDAVVKMINESNAQMVFVILGCPKQERWMAEMKGKINAVMIGTGGALPVLTGEQKRAPLWMQKSGLEWFYRLIREPRRLFKRYAITNTIFLFIFLKEIIKVHILKRKTIHSKQLLAQKA